MSTRWAISKRWRTCAKRALSTLLTLFFHFILFMQRSNQLLDVFGVFRSGIPKEAQFGKGAQFDALSQQAAQIARGVFKACEDLFLPFGAFEGGNINAGISQLAVDVHIRDENTLEPRVGHFKDQQFRQEFADTIGDACGTGWRDQPSSANSK